MKHIALILTLIICSLASSAQEYRYNPMNHIGVPTIDVTNDKRNIHTIARDENSSILYPSVVSVSSGVKKERLLLSYLIADTDAKTYICGSQDAGKTWSIPKKGGVINNFEKKPTSMFSISVPASPAKNNVILFLGKSPIQAIISNDEGETWSEIGGVNEFGGYKVTSCVKLNDGRTMALFHDDGRFFNSDFNLNKSVIYKIYSYDGGYTWSKPEIALKHNIYGLYDAYAFKIRSGNSENIAIIASERKNKTSVISISTDDGNTWSYPLDLPTFIHGDRFYVTQSGNRLLIAYRDLYGCNDSDILNPTYGNLVLWVGTLNQLNSGGRGSYKVRVGANYPTKTDRTDLRVIDCGYPSIIQKFKRQYSIFAYGRWETQSPAYLKRFDIDLDSLDKYYKNNYK